MTWEDLEPLDVIFPNSDSAPWLVTWKGRDEHGMMCIGCLDLHTGEHDEIEVDWTRFSRLVKVLRGGEDVNR